jgi:hypothetical protein
MIYEVPNFLDKNSCKKLIDYFNNPNTKKSNQRDDFFKNSTVSPHEMEDEKLLKIIEELKYKTTQLAVKVFPSEKFLYLDYCDVVIWDVGKEMGAHADNSYPNRESNKTPYRDYTFIIYLNHDYRGGQTYFVNENKTCIPETGKIVIFPSGLQYTHGVTKIISGTRYTLAGWLTRDKEKMFFDERILSKS